MTIKLFASGYTMRGIFHYLDEDRPIILSEVKNILTIHPGRYDEVRVEEPNKPSFIYRLEDT